MKFFYVNPLSHACGVTERAMGNSSVMQKRSPLCSMRHAACIFSIMVSMLVRPTFVLSVRCWPGRTAFSKASPALPFSLTKRTEMSCAAKR